MSNSDRVQTGIPGLDELLDGGFPRGRIVLLVGGPGSGKTIFCSQFIINGIEKHNENGVYVGMDEEKSSYLRDMSTFGWDSNLKNFEEDKKWAFVDASPVKHLTSESKAGKITIGSDVFSLSNLIEEIQDKVNEVNAKRLIVDPITSLVFQYPDAIERRSTVLNLIKLLRRTNATSILTTELKTSGLERNILLEEYLAHGVIILQTLHFGKETTRAFHIEKMRGTSIDPQIKPYRITKNGIEIYPQESVFYGVKEQ